MSSSNQNTFLVSNAKKKQTRILIVDNQSLSSELIKSQLKPEPNINVIGSVHTEVATFEVIKNFLPDIIIVDFDVPEINGFALVKKVNDNFPVVKTIVFTHSDRLGYINQALSLGASGFLIKNSSAEEVRQILDTILSDRSEDTKLQLPIPSDPIEVTKVSHYEERESIEEVRKFLDRVTSDGSSNTKLQPAYPVNKPQSKSTRPSEKTTITTTTSPITPSRQKTAINTEPATTSRQNTTITTTTSPITPSRQNTAITTTQPAQNAEIVPANNSESSLVAVEQEDWSAATKDLMDALPRVWTRGLLYFLVIGTAIILPWSVLTKVDQTGTARGRLEPKDKVIELDAPVAAKIQSINVKEGEAVKKGAILAELGSEVVTSELEQLKDKRAGLMQRLSQLELMQNQAITAISTKEDENTSRLLEKQSQLAQARQNLSTLKTVYESQKNEKLAQIEQVKQEIASSMAARKEAELALEGARGKTARYEAAYKEGVISQDRFLDIEQQAKENQERLAQATSAVEQSRSRLKEQQSSYENLIKNSESEIKQAQLRVEEQENSDRTLAASGKLEKLQTEEQLQDLQSQIAQVNTEVAQTNKQIESSQFELKQRQIIAPADGTVFHIAARGKGSVIQPGENIIEIAPENSNLILKADIPPTDSGFLKKGMPVKVKFDAYPFQDYGVSEGELVSISPDSKVTETPQGRQETYELKVELDEPYILDGAKKIMLAPGQTATAEVIVRQRRVIDFFLDPFKQLQEDGVKL